MLGGAVVFALILCAVAIIFSLHSDLRSIISVILSPADAEAKGAVNARRPSLLARCFPRYGTACANAITRVSTLQQSEVDFRTRYEVLTTNVAAAVIIHETSGAIMWSSPFTEVLTGFATSEIQQHASDFFSNHVHEEDREKVAKALAIISLGEPFHFKYRFYHKSGTLLWLETRMVPIFDDGLDDYVALSMTFDVTASVNNQLYVEERNRDLQDFTYMISHDLKAPIFTIRGMLGIVEEDITPECPSSIVEAISYITRSTNRLESLVNGILELAKISAAERSLVAVNLRDVFSEIFQDYTPALTECGGTLRVPSDEIWALGHPTHLYQVFSNLVNNAIKYRDESRPLVIDITYEPSRATRRTIVSVTDNGRGIPEDKLPLLFKPFQRIGEENIEGTGVGLACVARLLEKFSGSISAKQAPEHGTQFTIELRRSASGEVPS